nr:hypothetical protein [Ideonella sp. A 288]
MQSTQTFVSTRVPALPSQLLRLATAMALGSRGGSIAAQKIHDLVGTELPELRLQAAPDTRRRGTQHRAPVLLHRCSHRCDDDPAALQAEGDLAARRNTGRITDVLGDRDLALLRHMHVASNEQKLKYEFKVGLLQPAQTAGNGLIGLCPLTHNHNAAMQLAD